MSPFWQDKERDEKGSALPEKARRSATAITRQTRTETCAPPGAPNGAAEDCYLPGNAAADYRINHAAKLVPAGYDMVFNLHYTPNGTAVTDHVKVGFTIADKAPDRRYVSLSTTASPDPKKFAIPPNVSNWQALPPTPFSSPTRNSCT